MQNAAILHFTRGFCLDAPTHLICRARDGLRGLSDCADYVETKGFLLNSASERASHSFTNGRLVAVPETAAGPF